MDSLEQASPVQNAKNIQVTMSWTDRCGQVYNVVVNTVRWDTDANP